MDLIAVVEGVTGIIGVLNIKDITKYVSDRIEERRKPVTELYKTINNILESICIYI